MDETSGSLSHGKPRRVKSPREFGAGLFLVAVAAFALWFAAPLDTGSLSAIGSGMLPKSLAVLVGGLGIVIAVSALFTDGPGLDRWTLRGPLCVLGAVVVFALTIRTLGLVVAGPLAVMIGAYATDDVRPVETLIFAVVLTGACLLLFKTLLGLPIPVATFL
jgi:putative tricarboxylic transport membrane protein